MMTAFRFISIRPSRALCVIFSKSSWKMVRKTDQPSEYHRSSFHWKISTPFQRNVQCFFTWQHFNMAFVNDAWNSITKFDHEYRIRTGKGKRKRKLESIERISYHRYLNFKNAIGIDMRGSSVELFEKNFVVDQLHFVLLQCRWMQSNAIQNKSNQEWKCYYLSIHVFIYQTYIACTRVCV